MSVRASADDTPVSRDVEVVNKKGLERALTTPGGSSQDLVGDSTRLFNWVWDTFAW